ncbi:MAG: hypothetical protein C4518_06855 [Desulfobacteraceae bacterium]|nr:MAG: hypothetical protein C4518_06855 [Desulfobacteraceae bacterium]
MKTVLILGNLTLMMGALITCRIRHFIYITLVFIFFPIHLAFMSNDAITTGTICIFLLFLKYLTDCFFKRRFIKDAYDWWVYLLIIFGALSIIWPYATGTLEQTEIGRAVRLFFGFLGAMLLFLVIKNAYGQNALPDALSFEDHMETLLTLILTLVGCHILIAVIVKYFPSFGAVFNPFLSRDHEIMDIYGRGGIERIGTFVFTYEALAEILAALVPVVVYKIFHQRTMAWFTCFLLFSAGILLTATRSGIMLFVTGVILSTLFYAARNFRKSYALVFLTSSLLMFLVFFYPSVFADVTYRFSEAGGTYSQGGTFIEVINREGVFTQAWNETVSHLSFVGNGVTEFHFHNLFLTTLHQKGIIGVTLFFIVFLWPLISLIQLYRSGATHRQPLIFACALSITLLLINETKYEFTRSASYQQIWWGIIATYLLISRTPSINVKQEFQHD